MFQSRDLSDFENRVHLNAYRFLVVYPMRKELVKKIGKAKHGFHFIYGWLKIINL
ncbi:MAG: hypothetical protein QXW18_05420 [Candidatus Bathyarchaeia archaeon]